MADALQNEITRYTAANPKSAALHQRALKVMPGGDSRNSIWWAPFPTYLTSGRGVHVYDVDGNERVDMVSNMTTLIVGHRHPKVIAALRDQLDRGVSFPAPSPSVIKWAEILCDRVPSLDKVRFVNSGTEGTLNAIRAARAFTGRQKIVTRRDPTGRSATAKRRPGRAEVPDRTSSPPSSSIAPPTWSCSPTEIPPEVTTKSASVAAAPRSSRTAARSSPA
jgi:hypothetical protein